MDKFSWHEGKGAKWYLFEKKKKKDRLKTLTNTFYETIKSSALRPFFIYSLRKIKCQLHRNLTLYSSFTRKTYRNCFKLINQRQNWKRYEHIYIQLSEKLAVSECLYFLFIHKSK